MTRPLIKTRRGQKRIWRQVVRDKKTVQGKRHLTPKMTEEEWEEYQQRCCPHCRQRICSMVIQ